MIRLAISAAQEKNQGLLGQVLDKVLTGRRGHLVGLAGVPDDASAGDSNAPLGSHDPSAPVPEPVAICANRYARVGRHQIGNDDIGRTRIMDVQGENHRSGLRTLVDQFIANSDLHTQVRSYLCLSAQPPGEPDPWRKTAEALSSFSTVPFSTVFLMNGSRRERSRRPPCPGKLTAYQRTSPKAAGLAHDPMPPQRERDCGCR